MLVLGYIVDWSAQGHNPFTYFGYFTNLTSLLTATAFIVSGAIALAGHRRPNGIVLVRAIATSCLLVVAFVYNVLTPGAGSSPGWVSVLLHVVLPLVVFVDWLIVPDHASLRWSQL